MDLTWSGSQISSPQDFYTAFYPLPPLHICTACVIAAAEILSHSSLTDVLGLCVCFSLIFCNNQTCPDVWTPVLSLSLSKVSICKVLPFFVSAVGIHPPWMKKAEKKAHGHVCNQYLHYNYSAVKSFQIKQFQIITCFITHKGYFDFKAKQTGIGWIELNYDFRLKCQLKWKKTNLMVQQ